jgi:Radical SAM superfamily
MPAEADSIPFLSDLGLLMTYRCQVTCPHCVVRAGPNRKECVRLEEVCDWITQLASYRDGWVRILALTGGEPFYDLSLLRAVAEFAKERGLLVTVVTNGFWASSHDRAIRVLEALEAVSNVAFSTDVYHQVSIPLEYVKNGVVAARRCGKPYLISVCTENRRDPAYLEIMTTLREFTDDEHLRTAIALPVGRAANQLDSSKYDWADTPPRSACSSSSPIIFPDGRVVACIGPVIELKTPHPLFLGDLRRESLTAILDRAETNTILHMIRVWGPNKLVSLVRNSDLAGFLPERYISSTICQTCYHLMATPRLVNFLEDLARDQNLQRTTAYGRAYYLEEPQAMERLGLMPVAS